MRPNVLVAAGVAVVAAIVAIFVLGKSKDDVKEGSGGTSGVSKPYEREGWEPGSSPVKPNDPAVEPGPPAGQPMVNGVPQRNPGPPPLDPNAGGANAAGTVTPRDQPRGTPAGSGGGATPTDSYAVGDVHVRDHRAGSAAPMDIPPNVHPPGSPLIQSTLTNAIGQKVKAVIYECAKGTSRDGRGDKPRVEGQIIISVKANVVTVIEAIMQPRDVSAATTAGVKACAEAKTVGLTAPAPDQADLENYSINISSFLP